MPNCPIEFFLFTKTKRNSYWLKSDILLFDYYQVSEGNIFFSHKIYNENETQV